MKPIKNFNTIRNVSEMLNKQSSFDANPLDVNLAKMQFNLIKRLELEMPEYGDFMQILEKYTSKSQKLNVGDIVLRCAHKQTPSKLDRTLNIVVFDKLNPDKRINHTIATGTKKEILEAIQNKDFFETCKKIVLESSEQLGK